MTDDKENAQYTHAQADLLISTLELVEEDGWTYARREIDLTKSVIDVFDETGESVGTF